MNTQPQHPPHIFKQCPSCGYKWTTRDTFLSDPLIILLGYQVNFSALDLGYLLFNHTASECRTTMAIEAGLFRDLYDGPTYSIPLTNTDTCPGYCLHKEELRLCPEKCECAYVREIIQIIKKWDKD